MHFNWKFLTFLCCRKYLFLSLGWRLSSWLISVNQKVPLIFLFLSLVLQSKAHMDVLAWIMHCILSVLCWNEISRTRWFDRHLTTRWAPPCLSGPSILFNKPKSSIFRPFLFLSPSCRPKSEYHFDNCRLWSCESSCYSIASHQRPFQCQLWCTEDLLW